MKANEGPPSIEHALVEWLQHELLVAASLTLNSLRLLRGSPPSPALKDMLYERMEKRSRAVRSFAAEELSQALRILHGEEQFVTQPLSLALPLMSAFGALQAEADEKRVTVWLDTGSDPLIVPADSEALALAFRHLIRNGVKQTPSGGRVTVVMRGESERVSVEVRDTGPGFSNDRDPFALFAGRTAATSKGATGFGLGLATCQRIVAAHGGTITTRNQQPGPGAVVTVQLPRLGVPATPGRSQPG